MTFTTCRRTECGQITRTAIRGVPAYCSFECIDNDRVLAVAERLDSTDADSAFVAEQMIAAAKGTVAPTGRAQVAGARPSLPTPMTSAVGRVRRWFRS